MTRGFFSAALLIALCASHAAQSQQRRQGPMVFQTPAVTRAHVAFVYAGSVWLVDRAGGEARRLTGAPGNESFPAFSPDGSLVAFSKTVGGNTDVYVAPAAGGEPRRLTFHPDVDLAGGWTPDGTRVLLRSARASAEVLFTYRLYTIPARGGFEEELPLPVAAAGSFSPDAASIAYSPYRNMGEFWRNYRGGRTLPVLVARLSDSAVAEIPRQNSNDSHPMWIGDTIYFVSDRTETANLFAYDVRTKRVSQLTRFAGYDIRSASACADAIVFVREGALHLYDLKTGQARPVDVRVNGDFPEVRPRKARAAPWLNDYGLSPDGSRVVLGARGEILILDAGKNVSRNLTRTPGASERSPAWSADGRRLAYFSDESGEYQLHVRAVETAEGEGGVKKISIESRPSFYGEPVWSPDSKRLAFSDKRLALWIADAETGATRRVDTSAYARQGAFQPAWSPDGRWLAYSKAMPSRLSAVLLHSLETGKTYQVSGDRLDAENPVFDRNGQYLYFNASANAGPSKQPNSMTGGLILTSQITRKVYAAVLHRDGRSPLTPADDQDAEARRARPGIDAEGIAGRVVPLPFPAHNFADLAAGRPGVLFILGKWVDTTGGESPATRTLYKFDVATRKYEKFDEGIHEFRVSADGGRVLYPKSGGHVLVSTAAPPKPDEGKLNLGDAEIEIDPRAEWRQMFDEVWRIQRDYIYYPDLHGQDLAALKAKYAAYLPGVVTRNDLNNLFREMLSHVALSHLSVVGGDAPAADGRENTGVLGADFRVEAGRYRVARVYRGDNSAPALRGPLSQPGVEVKEGDFLLSVDGEEIRADENLYKYFRGKAGRPAKLKVAGGPDGGGARALTVVPLSSDALLRDFERVEDNRRTVRELSGGKLAYIYLPNVLRAGYEIFNRDYYAQIDKQGLIIDERFNAGGYGADYMIEVLQRRPLSAYAFREGDSVQFPGEATAGPRVMLVSEFAGSGGDSLPWLFRRAGVGPLVGRRTAGFGIGHYVSVPDLIDGGWVSAPNRAFYDPRSNQLEIENNGVAPDVEVAWTPADWRAGRDPQLLRAIQLAMDALKKSRPAPAPRPKPLR